MSSDGGTAFPGIEGEWGRGNATCHAGPNGMTTVQHNQGMSLRDWFAGKALEGDLAAQGQVTGEWADGNAAFLAKRCYVIADAMLAEREKKRGAA